MAGIALFVPNDEMYEQAQRSMENRQHHISVLKKINTEDAITEARHVISQGINIIIARGRQATIIRDNTNAMVTEIVMTAQELGLLVVKAKRIINKQYPRIGMFGWSNMLCDTTYFGELYGVDLRTYTLNEESEWRNNILATQKDKLDIIIGGEYALEGARQMGIPAIYLTGTGEAINLAIENAESLYRMSEFEQRNYAQFSTVLDSSFNGIMKINEGGAILVINRVMEEILGQKGDKILGESVTHIFKELDVIALNLVLSGKQESYSTFLNYNGQELVLIVEPIVVNEKVNEAIISCNKLQRLEITDHHIMTKQHLKGYGTDSNLDDIGKRLKDLRKVVELAKIYAQSSSPILIEAVGGPEVEAITQGIHNYSMRRNGPFIAISVSGMNEEQQERTLFGDYGEGSVYRGAILDANNGTLVIQGIDKLTLPNQYRLVQFIRSKRLVRNYDTKNVQIIDTRIIVCSAKNLTSLKNQFLFRSDLYFTLKSLRLRIPSLKERQEDVAYLLDTFIAQYMERYSRYHIMTPGAKRILSEYPWEGNSIQLQAFCERMILTVGRRSITEEYVRGLLEELYQTDSGIYESFVEAEIIQENEEDDEDPMYILLLKTLKKYSGNRTLTAKELKMSTTTLWRKMKKYGLDQKY